MNLKNNAAFAAISKLYKVFNAKQKKQFRWLCFLTFITSITDIVGLASIIPVVGLVLTDSFYGELIKALPFFSSFSRNHLLVIIVVLFVLIIIVKNLFGLYVNKLQTKFVESVFVSSTMNVLNRIYDYTLPQINKENSGVWVNKVSTMQMQLTSSVAISVMIIINEAIVFGLTAIIVCVWNWHLFLILIAVLFPAMGIFYARVKTLIKVAGMERNKNFVTLFSDAQEMIFGYADIKIAGTEDFLKERYEKVAKQYSIMQGKTDFIMFIPTRIIEVVIFVCIIIILLYGVFILKDINQIVTTISLFSVIAYRSIPSVNRFVMALNTITTSDYILNDKDFFAGNKEKNTNERMEPMVFDESIRFNNVSYRYEEGSKEVVRGLNLEIKKGDKIGIVGRSGSGKSTIINNVLGFLMPSSGTITIDGVTLSEDNIKSWWKIIGYVRQDVFIMNTSLLENIAIGIAKEDVDMEKLNRAIKLASLEELVKEMPDGVYTILSERGNNLSGGQKQRIAIARAIYKGAKVLVFDEATSALDNKTEIEITNAINDLGTEDLTIIIIAHRYTSLRYCNKIYKLESGAISDVYTYEQLAMLHK